MEKPPSSKLKDEQQILREGDAIYLDSFTNHNVKNDSDEPLVLFTLQFLKDRASDNFH